jgi:hypothetical protein
MEARLLDKRIYDDYTARRRQSERPRELPEKHSAADVDDRRRFVYLAFAPEPLDAGPARKFHFPIEVVYGRYVSLEQLSGSVIG